MQNDNTSDALRDEINSARGAVELALKNARNEMLKLANSLRDYPDRQDVALRGVEVLIAWQNTANKWIFDEYKKPRQQPPIKAGNA